MKKPSRWKKYQNNVFGDSMATLFFASIGIIMLLLFLINSASKNEDTNPPPQGNLIFELYWPDAIDTDVDLWVKSDSDNVAVGYSNKGAAVLNLLRDDLGTLGDISGKNQEVTYSRGIPDGEYIVNAHLYNLKTGKLPIPLTLIVSMNDGDNKDSYKQLFKVTSQLVSSGEERTIARFTIYDKKFIKDSFSNLQQKIRPYGDTTP